MAIKAGQILHAMNKTIVDRIQTGGAGNLNIPTERVYELGNEKSVAIVRDTPDLSFSLECLSVSTEVEQLLLNGTVASETAAADGTGYDLYAAKPVDIVSPFKASSTNFAAVRGVAVPHLTLESASYRFGMKENAGETFSLRGDSIFYVPGTPYVTVQTATAAQAIFPFQDDDGPSALTALEYTEGGQSIYALNVSVNGVRKVPGASGVGDYTETSTGITFNNGLALNDKVRIVFGSATAKTYAQSVNDNAGLALKPAAIRGKDIKVFLTAYNKTTGAVVSRTRWTDVQSVNLEWQLSLEEDWEFGNARAVSRDANEPPAVTGSVEIKPMDSAALFSKLTEITGVDAGDIIGPQSSVHVGLEVVLHNPDSGGTSRAGVDVGDAVKTLWVPDARFTIPGYEGRVSQKLTQTMNFESDSGTLVVYKGAK